MQYVASFAAALPTMKEVKAPFVYVFEFDSWVLDIDGRFFSGSIEGHQHPLPTECFWKQDKLEVPTPILNPTVSHNRLQPCSGLAGVRKFGTASLS